MPAGFNGSRGNRWQGLLFHYNSHGCKYGFTELFFFKWLASFLTGPIIGGMVDGYKAKLAAGNTSDRIAADLAQRELQVQATEIEVTKTLRIAQIGHWYEPEKLMGYTVAIYFAKLLIWDKVLGLGMTDGLTLKNGQWSWAGTTSNLIITYYFAKRGFENVARIIRK